MSVGVAVITYKAKEHLRFCLPPLLNSPLKPKVLVVNSSSNDGTVEEAERLGAETLIVPRSEFNHGKTRNLARKVLNTDIVVMMTPDAYPVNETFLEQLVEPLKKAKASLSYARQLPHDHAKPIEAFVRHFNYPDNSEIRSLQDLKKFGPQIFFCSNSAAAYFNAALDSIGGFQDVILGEDTLAAAHFLQNGHTIAYAANALVKHSHTYNLRQEFKRAFDTGLARSFYPKWPKEKGLAKFGGRYLIALMHHLLKQNPLLMPYGLAHMGAKSFGFLLGKWLKNAPIPLKRRLSSQDFYWQSCQKKLSYRRSK